MSRLVTCVLLLAVVMLPAASSATTFKGSLNPNSIQEVAVVSVFETQLLITLYVNNRNAWPQIGLGCEGVFLAQSVGVFRNFARLEASIPAGALCVVGLTSIQGGSAFTVNVELTSGRGSEVPDPPPLQPQIRRMSGPDFPWLKKAMRDARRLYQDDSTGQEH